jgi:FkbM family methyltransferase
MAANSSSLRPKVRQAFRQLGYEIHRLDGESANAQPPVNAPAPAPPVADDDPSHVLKMAFAETEPLALIDVGANHGGFVDEVREQGFAGPAISFEPLPEAYSKLRARAAIDPLWEVAPRMALGAEIGNTEINVSANSYSSSLLPMTGELPEIAPQTTYVDKVPVEIGRLDDVLADLSFDPARGYLKVDTQGFEHQVLLGAPETLKACVAVQAEISLVPMYIGAAPTWQTIALLGEAGFDLAYTSPVFASEGRMLQIDAIFTRR